MNALGVTFGWIREYAKELLPPIQLMCFISFYGQVTLIVLFFFWYGFLTFLPLVALSYFQLYPQLPILIFLPYIKKFIIPLSFLPLGSHF